MPRLARVVVPGLPHHVTQRGNRRQRTFFRDGDDREYLAILARWGKPFGIDVWAYCLMPNHVHLIVVPLMPDSLAVCIGEVHRRYTERINKRQGWKGYLWQGRFFSFPIDDWHLLAAVRYILLNPVRAGLVKKAEDWPYSSARAHLRGESDEVVNFGPLEQRIEDWKAFLRAPESDSQREQLQLHSRTGRPLGSIGFVMNLERELGRPLLPRKPGPKKKNPFHGL